MGKKGQIKYDQILAMAIHLISREGVAALSYESVAQQLGLIRPHIKYYFNSKEDLLMACFKLIGETAQKVTIETIEQEHSWRNRLMAVGDGAFEWLRLNPEHAPVLFIYYHYCAIHPNLAKLNEQFREVGRSRIEAILLSGAGANWSPQKLKAFAFEYQILISGLIMEMAATHNLKKWQLYRKKARTYIDQEFPEDK